MKAHPDHFDPLRSLPDVCHAVDGHPRRAEVEDFIRAVFRRRYGAEVPSFAPNLMLFERAEQRLAAVGWRSAAEDRLMLENYLDRPVEEVLAGLAGQPVPRGRIVEVGNLASDRRGSSIDVVHTLAAHLDRLGYEWVVFTATAELIGIFRRLNLPPLAIARADPARLGAQARAWGSYYAADPVVVAGRIRLALDKVAHHG